MQSKIRMKARFATLTLAIFALGLAGSATNARAQGPSPSGGAIAKAAVGFLSTGGYFITGSARHAIGSTKFYNEGGFYARPKHLGAIAVTGGVELISASDHFLPFQGGDYFSLTGPAFRITSSKDYHGLRPYLTGGLFYGQLRSTQLGFDRSAFTPSIAVGVDYKIIKNLSLSASYRVSQDINGFSGDGFGVFLRIF